MLAGRLPHRITLIRPAEAADPFGQLRPSPAVLGTYWAGVLTLSGREAERANQLVAEATHEVRMRYAVPVLAGDQILFDGRTFEVLFPRDRDNRKVELRILCKEALTGV